MTSGGARSLASADEPVRRYFEHAVGGGAADARGVRLAMAGWIKVGRWLPFVADWEGGWWFGTERYDRFFEAEIRDAQILR